MSERGWGGGGGKQSKNQIICQMVLSLSSWAVPPVEVYSQHLCWPGKQSWTSVTSAEILKPRFKLTLKTSLESLKGLWQEATLFVYFSYFITYIHSFNHIHTIHLSIAIRWGLSPLESLSLVYIFANIYLYFTRGGQCPVSTREYSVISRRLGFLAVVWFGSSPV